MPSENQGRVENARSEGLVYVTTPGKLRALPSEAMWAYLGGDVRDLATAEGHFDQRRRVVLGRRVANSVDALRAALNDAVADIGGRETDMVSWWAGELAHRARGGDLLLLAGFVDTFGSILAEARVRGGPTVVIIEDPWCFATAQDAFAAEPGVRFSSGAARWQRLRDIAIALVRGVMARSLCVARTLIEKIYFGLIRRAPMHSGKVGDARQVAWNFAFVESRLFATDGALNDPYLPRIQELAENADLQLRRFTNILFPAAYYRRIAGHQDSIEVMTRHVSIWETIRAAFAVPKFRAHPDDKVNGIPLEHLVRREWWKQLRGSHFMANIMWFRACQRFLTRPAVAESPIFFWWENQPWNKLLCMAADGLPARRVHLVGYQHCALSANQLNFFPSRRELGSLPIPDVVFTNALSAHEMLLQAGFPSECFVMAGSMRFSYEGQPAPTRRDPPFSASVYLPCDLLVAREIMATLVGNDEVWGRSQVRFFLHPHPDVPFSVIGLGPADGAALESAQHSVRECPGKVDLMICSNTVVSLEGVAMGMPVVSYVPERALWMDAAADNYPDYVTVCGSEDFLDAVLEAKNEWMSGQEPPDGWHHAQKIFPAWDEAAWRERGLSPARAVRPLPSANTAIQGR